MSNDTNYALLNNSRFYILVSTFLLSVIVFGWLRLQITSDQLFYIRLQQVFGLLCIVYWYVALIISPLGYVIGKQRLRHIEFARRAIGVSAFYFALLHAAVALWGQLGGLSQLSYLPSLFQWSLAGGAVSLGILFIMAITSFDKVIKIMTFRYWKWVHRFVYVGGVLAILHIWSVGTHLSYSAIQVSALIALIILSGLETYRLVTLLARKSEELSGKLYFWVIFASIWAAWIIAITGMPALIQSYHGGGSGSHEKATHGNVH